MLKTADQVTKKEFDRKWDWKGYRDDKVITVRVPSKLYEELHNTATEQGAKSISDVVRSILLQTIGREKQKRE